MSVQSIGGGISGDVLLYITCVVAICHSDKITHTHEEIIKRKKKFISLEVFCFKITRSTRNQEILLGLNKVAKKKGKKKSQNNRDQVTKF